MSVTHEWGPYGLVARFAERLTLEDLIEHISEIVRPPNLHRSQRALSDFTAVSHIDINASDVAEYARLEADFLDIRDVQHDIRLAIVCAHPEISTLVDVFVGSQPSGVMTIGKFASFDQAHEWAFGVANG